MEGFGEDLIQETKPFCKENKEIKINCICGILRYKRKVLSKFI